MKYNVFKRPMFKRGGISRGTGITSGLDTPRIGFSNGMGFGFMSAGQQFPIDYLKYGPGGKPPMLTKNASSPIKKATKAVAGSTSNYDDGLLDYWPYKEGDKFGNYDFWPTVPPGTRLDEEGKIIPKREELPPPTIIPGVPGGGDQDMFAPKKSIEDDTPAELTEEKATKSEEDLLLEKLGDTSLSKGEKALMLSEIIGTAGGMEGKTKKAIELMKAKSKEDRQLKKDITKLKYLQKGKERIAGIEAGELTTSQKDINAKVENTKAIARQKGLVTEKGGVTYYDGKTEAEIKNDIYDKLLQDKNVSLADKVRAKFAQQIVDLRDEIRKKKAKAKPGDENAQAKIRALEAQLEDMMNPGKYGIAEGGRVGYAQGTPMAEPQIAATQTEGANTTENTRPVNKLSFAELRNRLPKEITDDVVQLLANSEEALQDFAYIQTQEDINKFNIKYGVNVILPPQA